MGTTQPEVRNRGGRKPRYGVKLMPIYVRFHPALLEHLKRESKVRALQEPDTEWSVSRLIEQDISRLYRFDPNNQEG